MNVKFLSRSSRFFVVILNLCMKSFHIKCHFSSACCTHTLCYLKRSDCKYLSLQPSIAAMQCQIETHINEIICTTGATLTCLRKEKHYFLFILSFNHNKETNTNHGEGVPLKLLLIVTFVFLQVLWKKKHYGLPRGKLYEKCITGANLSRVAI